MEISHWVKRKCPDVVVMEDFILRSGPKSSVGDRSGTFPLVMIGAIGALLGGYEVVLQPVSVAKQFATDRRLRDLGVYRGGMPHAMDALRHVFALVERDLGGEK